MDSLDLFNANIAAVAVYTPVLVGLLLLAGRRLPASFASGFAFAGFALPLVLGLWLVFCRSAVVVEDVKRIDIIDFRLGSGFARVSGDFPTCTDSGHRLVIHPTVERDRAVRG